MSIALQIPDPIKRVSRSVGYALWLDHSDAYLSLPVVLGARLTPRQCAGLAHAALKSLDADAISKVTETAQPNGEGAPIAPLINHMDEATFWADMAEPETVEAYCLACFNAMPAHRKAAFLGFVQGRNAA